MKGDNAFKILKELKEKTLDMADLMTAFLKSPYGASMSRFDYEFNKLQKERRNDEQKEIIEKQLRQRFYDIIYKLGKDGLIEKGKNKEGIIARITPKGNKYFEVLKKRKQDVLPDPDYKKVENFNFTIAIFDIPEKERRKREWLRSALKNMGFNLIQESVWMGKVKIPKEFLEDLKELRMVNFVEIFEISKRGTLRQIT